MGRRVWHDTYTDQGPGGTGVVTQGSAHGLVVIHGHSENQKQGKGLPPTPFPTQGEFAAGFPFTRIPEGAGVRVGGSDNSISALGLPEQQIPFPSKGPYDLLPLSTSFQVSSFRKVALGALWGFHYGFLRSGS